MKSDIQFRSVRFGPERMAYNKEMPRHRHMRAYATLVLAGEFVQFSYAGRLQLQAGDVLINPTLDYHSNRMRSRGGVTLVRLPWRHEDACVGVSEAHAGTRQRIEMWSRKLLLTIDAYIIDTEVVGENKDDVRAFGSDGRRSTKRRRRTGG